MKTSNTSERLKKLMVDRNLKQVDILERVLPYCEQYGVKISKPHISQWVSGINEPNQRSLTILGKALGVDEVWLMGYDVPMKPEDSGTELAKIAKNDNLMEIMHLVSQLDDVQQEVLLNLLRTMVEKGE